MTHNGTPLTKGTITFDSEKGFFATGTVNADGTFELQGPNGPNIPAGTYKVGVSPPPTPPPAAGATEIIVNDSHGPMRNLVADLLHHAAELIQGRHTPKLMVEGIDESFDALFLVGDHGRAGSARPAGRPGHPPRGRGGGRE